MIAVATGAADRPAILADKTDVPPISDPTHLRLLLDRQPSCLIRVGTDGVLLAVNDAALSLLGASDLNSVLDTTLTDRIVPEQRGAWTEFSARVWRDASGSHECDLIGPSGSRRPVMLQGVALSDHPDGIPSILVTLRDVSATRRLENALQEHTSVRQTADKLQTELQRAVAEQHRLAALLAEKDDEVQRVLLAGAAEREALAAYEAQRAELDQTAADRHRFEAAFNQAEADRQALAQELADARAEHQRLLAEIVQSASERAEATEGKHRAEQDALRAELDAVRAELDQAALHRQQLRTALDEADAERRAAQTPNDRDGDHERLQAMVDQLAAEGVELKALLEQARIDQEQLVSELAGVAVGRDELQAAVAQLNSALEQASVERKKIESRLAGTVKAYEQFDAARRKREVGLQETLAENVNARSDAERALAEARTENTLLAKTVADQRVDLSRLAENARELEWLAGAGRLAINLAREFQSVTAVLESAAGALLEHSSVDGAERERIETIRGSALRVASLARQMAVAERSF